MGKSKSFTRIRDEEFIVSEAEGRRSREQAVIDSTLAAELEPGTVLGAITASGKYLPLNLAGGDGTENAAAIALTREEVQTPAADVRSGIFARDGEVNGNMLVWPAGITGPQQAAAEAQLAANGIIVRY